MNVAGAMMAQASGAGRSRTRRTAEQLAEHTRQELAKLQLRLAQKQARLEKFEAVRTERERKLDTRRKIVAGAIALEHMKRDPAFASAMNALLNEHVATLPDRALFGLAMIDPATGQPIETAEKGPLAAPRAQG